MKKPPFHLTDKQIKIICLEFRKGVLGRRKSRAMCAKVSWALQGYLNFLGLPTRVCEGDVGEWNHLWLALPDGRVIDATADQFSTARKKYPQVYIGKPLSIHKEMTPSQQGKDGL